MNSIDTEFTKKLLFKVWGFI